MIGLLALCWFLSMTITLRPSGEMNLKLLLHFAFLQSSISIDIPSSFITDLMKQFSKKYVIWHLHQNQNSLQSKRNLTEFGR